MAALAHTPRSRLSRWAIGLAIIAAVIGIVLEIVKVSLGHPARWEGVLAALLILGVAFNYLRQTRRR